MFALSYQTGATGVELLTPSGTQKSGSIGTNVVRTYDRDIKGYLFVVNSSSSAGGIQCPISVRDSLGVIQPLLLLQLQTREKFEKVVVEVVIIDTMSQRHRLFFSSSFTRADANPLHVQLPWSWSGSLSGEWNSTIIDLRNLTSRFFGRSVEFEILDSIKLYGSCRVRKIFTLPASALESESYDGTFNLKLPPLFDFPFGVKSFTSLYTVPEISTTKPQKPNDSNLKITGAACSLATSSKTVNAKTTTPIKASPISSTLRSVSTPNNRIQLRRHEHNIQLRPGEKTPQEITSPMLNRGQESIMQALTPLRYVEDDVEEYQQLAHVDNLEPTIIKNLTKHDNVFDNVFRFSEPNLPGSCGEKVIKIDGLKGQGDDNSQTRYNQSHIMHSTQQGNNFFENAVAIERCAVQQSSNLTKTSRVDELKFHLMLATKILRHAEEDYNNEFGIVSK